MELFHFIAHRSAVRSNKLDRIICARQIDMFFISRHRKQNITILCINLIIYNSATKFSSHIIDIDIHRTIYIHLLYARFDGPFTKIVNIPRKISKDKRIKR